MSPKPGTEVTLIAPMAVKDALDADDATTGSVTDVQRESAEKKKAALGTTKVKPHKPPQTQEEKEQKSSWIEIELVDEADQPLPGVRYKVTLPDDTVDEGTLDAKGFARVEGFEPGSCKVSFPDLDQEAWEQA